MPADTIAVSPEPTNLATLRMAADAIAEDAESLAALHDRELTPDLVTALIEAKFPACLGLMPATAEVAAAWRAMSDQVTRLPIAPDAKLLDELAAEYAAIYLTNAYGASPCESVWTDDDHLVCQTSMFQLRDIYASVGLAATDWRQRPDDHLVLQLLYVAHAARKADSLDDWRALARMLDEHPLRWIHDFASRIATRSSTPFYAELAILTAAWLDTLRDLLARQLDEPRPSREAVEERLKQPAPVVAQPVAFVPGCGPSW
jgi:putative dimethyl sulfoxide reductase chaperone